MCSSGPGANRFGELIQTDKSLRGVNMLLDGDISGHTPKGLFPEAGRALGFVFFY